MDKIGIQAEYSREDGYRFGYSEKPEEMTELEYQQAIDSLLGAVAASVFNRRANGNAIVAKAFVDGFARSVKMMMDDATVMGLLKEGE